MSTKKSIIISSVIIIGFALLFLAYRFFPNLQKLYLQHELESKYTTLKETNYILYLPLTPKKLIFLVPTVRMDKFWNSSHIQTNLGLRIAKILLERQIAVLLYDRIDGNAPPLTFFSPQKLREDFQTLINKINQEPIFQNQISEFSILAHGDGCNVALLALDQIQDLKKLKDLYLFQCGYPNSLLDFYLEVIFLTMKITKVEEDIIQKAKEQANQWRQKTEYETITEEEWEKKQKEMIEKKIHPDIIAFLKTLYRFQFPENQEFLKESKTIYFEKLLNSILMKNVAVTHVLSEMDEEYPKEFIEHFRNQKPSSEKYQLHILKNTDHFLFYNDEALTSPIEILFHRNYPLHEISDEVLELINKM